LTSRTGEREVHNGDRVKSGLRNMLY
jgi:hypothetical protein